MKLLLIGMDGAQAATFKRGWTPFLASLIDQGTSLVLKEDLISRGWSEIVTGEPGIVTGALYEHPLLKGTHGWTEKFKIDDIPGIGDQIKPLWQVLNERGYRVGFMNVPTTYPAPKVNGFFVSGGGGGGPVSQTPVSEQCYPPEILQTLAKIDYIVDERLRSLLSEKKLYQPSPFFSRLEEKNEKRTDAFIELAINYDIDFGFVVYRSAAVTAETLLLPEWERHLRGDNRVNVDFLNAAEHFYRHFDEQIVRLIAAFPDAEVMLVSDHAMAIRRWSVNANAFLADLGFQKCSLGHRNVYDFTKQIRHWIPYSLRQKIKKNSKIKTAYESMITFEPQSSLAFSMGYSNGAHGIYINDTQRFGGPVAENAIQALVEKIVVAFNEHPLSREHGFSAHSKAEIKNQAARYFPDVILELPDGYMTSNEFSVFLTQLTPQPTPIDLVTIQNSQRLTGKAHQPLAINVSHQWAIHPTPHKQDLRLIYDHVLATLS